MTCEIANTILAQLGGNRFIAMTGAKDFLGLKHGLSFKLRRNDSGVNYVRIDLTPDDTYTVTFAKITHRGTKVTDKGTYEGIYADMLRGLFTRVTGMETSLGTMGVRR